MNYDFNAKYINFSQYDSQNVDQTDDVNEMNITTFLSEKYDLIPAKIFGM